jgi:hypothetical protein
MRISVPVYYSFSLEEMSVTKKWFKLDENKFFLEEWCLLGCYAVWLV